MIRIVLVLFLVCGGSVVAQRKTTGLIHNAEKITWVADNVYNRNSYDTATGYFDFYLRSLTYSKDNKVIWQVDVPERMKRYKASSIFVRNGIQDSIVSRPDVNNQKDFLRCGESILNRVIAISDQTGFLVLDKSDGRTIVDIVYDESRDHFYIDSGRYEVRKKSVVAAGTLNHGAAFIATHKDYLFHFSGSELLIFGADYKLLANNPYLSSDPFKSGGAATKQLTLYWKKFKIVIKGIVYL